VQYPWCVWQVCFTPHPRPLSPARGEGSWMRISGRKADSIPLSPLRGEGMGVRGQRTLPAHRKRLRGSVDPASSCSIRGACGRCVSPLTPDPSPLPGERGAGCGFQGGKQTLSPLSPLRGEGMGVRGQRTLPAPRKRFRDTANPASSCSIRGACGRRVSPLTPDPSPLPGERGA
jgi:hypothetical protein